LVPGEHTPMLYDRRLCRSGRGTLTGCCSSRVARGGEGQGGSVVGVDRDCVCPLQCPNTVRPAADIHSDVHSARTLPGQPGACWSHPFTTPECPFPELSPPLLVVTSEASPCTVLYCSPPWRQQPGAPPYSPPPPHVTTFIPKSVSTGTVRSLRCT